VKDVSKGQDLAKNRTPNRKRKKEQNFILEMGMKTRKERKPACGPYFQRIASSAIFSPSSSV
jgi:hypothetical protein